tara:strand:+ start:690 stop:1286 length:597 start_codon:yes stop_codon:yes gene_type:complete
MIAVEEKGVSYEPRLVNLFDAEAKAEFRMIAPLGKVPYLVRADGVGVGESTNIVEYLDHKFIRAGNRLIPDDAEAARQVRYYDRICDLYLNQGIAKILIQGLKPEDQRDENAIAEGKAMLDMIYPQLEQAVTDHQWLAGDTFSLADCSAASPLYYCNMMYPFGDYPALCAYYKKLTARPSFAKISAQAEQALKDLGLI